MASTEILESSFGKRTRIEGPQSQDGLTVLSVAMGAIVGDRTDAEVRTALESTPQKVVDRWFERVGGHSVHWLRQQFVREAKAYQNRDERRPDSRPNSNQASPVRAEVIRFPAALLAPLARGMESERELDRRHFLRRAGLQAVRG